jgi:hypothetical protein
MSMTEGGAVAARGVFAEKDLQEAYRFVERDWGNDGGGSGRGGGGGQGGRGEAAAAAAAALTSGGFSILVTGWRCMI